MWGLDPQPPYSSSPSSASPEGEGLSRRRLGDWARDAEAGLREGEREGLAAREGEREGLAALGRREGEAAREGEAIAGAFVRETVGVGVVAAPGESATEVLNQTVVDCTIVAHALKVPVPEEGEVHVALADDLAFLSLCVMAVPAHADWDVVA